MSWKKFLVVDAASALFTIALWGGLGYVGGNSIETLRRDITRIEHISVAILTITIVTVMLFKYIKSRRNTSGRPLLQGPPKKIEFQ